MKQDIETVLITEAQLKTRIAELAAELKRDFAPGSNPLFIGVLKGSFMFIADLMRAYDYTCAVDFMAVSSYGAKSQTTGQVRILKDIGQDIEGRDIIIVEDILDSGVTLNYLMQMMQARRPKSVRICTLLDKPSRRRIEVKADYIGFTIDDAFVVGYGLDFDEKYRNMSEIGILKPSVYAEN